MLPHPHPPPSPIFHTVSGNCRLHANNVTRDRIVFFKTQGFATDESVTVMLVSLKAGGVGLNLTAASTVILLDPWW